MPNRGTHEPIGVLAGGIAAGVAAHRVGGSVLPEGLGGGCGGWLGARLPDWIDPPTSPRHRSLGHGIAPALVVLGCTAARVPDWQADLRQRAAEHRAACDSSSTVWQQFLHHLLELLYHVASGALVGLLWGYSSHLAMDATTAASLPLFA